MTATPQQYFEATERYGYALFSEVAAGAGRDFSAGSSSVQGGRDTSVAVYNPVLVEGDLTGAPGAREILLRERVERLATPRVLAGKSWNMVVHRWLVVERVTADLGIRMVEEIIERPPFYRSVVNAVVDELVLEEVAAAEVEFGNPEQDLQNQARYVGWLGVARGAMPQLVSGR